MSWTCDNGIVTSGQFYLAARGNWSARLVLAADAAPSVGEQVALALPGVTLRGTVWQGGTYAEQTRVALVGGMGKLQGPVTGQHYRNASPRMIAQGLCQEAGEVLDPASSATDLDTIWPHWHHFGGPLARALDALCGALQTPWRMTAAGQIFLGEPTWGPAAEEGLVLQDHHQDRKAFLVAPEDTALLPGTVYQGQRLVAVDHEISANGWRACARYA